MDDLCPYEDLENVMTQFPYNNIFEFNYQLVPKSEIVQVRKQIIMCKFESAEEI
jgi:hypothetical protein